ncbi:MAG TPA: carboxypeptidase regulatory-like domain-containing protein [Burkholderiales bacterium]|nr:carboxypeptidase regulatory-like domain-containing protein [Burkholderiales bacterium]
MGVRLPRGAYWWSWFTLLLLLVSTAPARAQGISPEVSRGLSWLQGQVQANGSLANEATSLATPLQNRSEAAQALAVLASVPPSLSDAIAAEPDANTEYLARRAIALIAAGRDAAPQINLLLLRRNADRGFGGGPGFESNPLDTAWTVLALARAGQGAGAVARDARAYLMANMQADGGITAPNDLARIEYSALALFALQTVGDGSTATAVRSLLAWMLQRQAADGSFQGDVHLTALSLIAIAPVVSDPALRAAAGAFLISRQSAAGSWQDDPFQTAIALRALGAGSASPAAATLAGQIVDQATNLPLAGASISVSGAGTAAATTDSEGKFAADGLAAGSYSAQIMRAGYNGASASYTLFAGQTFDAGRIALTQVPATGIVRGRVTAATGGLPLPGVQISISGAAALSATTDLLGRFELPAVPPGAVTVSASLLGYQLASGSGTLAGGATLDFSPTLYTDAETAPTTGRFIGRVVVAGTGAPLPGVAVVLNGTPAGTSAGDGTFDLTLPPLSYVALYTLTGYDSASQGFVLAAGTTVDAGTVALPAQRTTTTITGRVTDTQGTPLSDATVQVIGGGSATTGPDGVFTLSDLAGLSFDLRASATGYASQLVTLQVSRPADVAHNFALFAGSASFAIGEPAVNPLSAGANASIAVTASVSNIGTTPASAVVMMQILDADGANGPAGAVIGTAGAFDLGGMPVGLLQLEAEQARELRFTWNTGRFAAGRYDFLIRLVAPDSITAATPQGSVLLERPASASVTAQTHFAGSVTANPPVLRAGTNTPVALSAVIQNDGNAQLPPQTYTLSVINTQTNVVAHSQNAAGPVLAVSEVTSLAFQPWAPPAGGNFRVELTSANAAEGNISTSLYVGDSGAAQYTVNKLVVPAGTQPVRANIRVTGQDVDDGTINDPLAPLVRTAIQRAVSFTDTSTRTWTLTNQCMGCHTQAQALVGGELNRNLATFNPRTRATIFNGITFEQQPNGSISVTNPFPRTMTTLGLWGLASYRDKPSIAQTLKKAVDYLVTQQDSLGRWFADHASGWWGSEVTNTAFNLKNVSEMHGVLGALPPQAVQYYAFRAFTPTLNRTSRGFLTVDGAGNLYFSGSGQVVQIRPDNTIGTIWPSLSDPRSVVEVGGALLVATGSGLLRMNGDGTTTVLNSHGNFDHLILGPDGRIYGNDFGGHRIYQIDPASWAFSIWFAGSPLANPARLAFTPEGDLLVANLSGRNILRFKPNKAVDAVVELTGGQPIGVMAHGGGWLVSTTTGVYRYNADWESERLLYERVDMIAALPDGRLVSVVNGVNNIREIFGTAQNVAASLPAYATAVDRATTFLTNLNSLGNTNNLVLAHHIMGLGAAHTFYKDANPARAATLRTKMEQIAVTLRSRVRPDGGWGLTTGHGTDSMVTAQVGVALDHLDPSPDDPIVRNAVQLLLNRQQADGSWRSENFILPTNQAATSWVAIWLPIILNRLGGIDTDLSVTFAGNVTMANPTPVPTSSLLNPDGTRTVVWRMVGVTASGRDVAYDLSLANMAVNETRPVSLDAHLTFRNDFTGGAVDAPIDIPRITASAFLDLGVTTERTLYTANSAVNITGQVTNTDGGLAGGSVKFEIRAADDGLVVDLGTLPFSGVGPGVSANLTPAWNTGGTLAGSGFYVLASLFDSQGAFVGSARSTFGIVGSETGTLASARISSDKQIYLPSDTAQVLSRASNLTQNQPLTNVTLVTTVLNTDGSVRFTRSELIPELVQSGLRDFTYGVPIAFAPAGVYSSTVSLRDASGIVLASHSATFAVQTTSASGSGLTGTLLAAPRQVPLGDAAVLSLTARNQGNSALLALPLTLRIVNPQAEQVLAEFPETVDLATGATHLGARSFTPSGAIGTTFVGVLSAMVGTTTVTLAQDNFTLIAPPVQLDASFAQLRQARVLALVSCKRHSDGDHDDDDDDDGGGHHGDDDDDDGDNSYSHSHGHHGSHRKHHHGHSDHRGYSGHSHHGDHDGHGHHQQSSCSTARAAFLGAYLTSRGVTHLVTTNTSAFKHALRSGRYNVYWLSGGREKLHDTLAAELREAVFRGDALVLDGVHDERNHILDSAAGIKPRGKLSSSSQAISLTGALFTPGTLPSVGQPLKFDLVTAVTQAVFPASGNRPAIVSNEYGLGRGVLFAYDLVGTAMAHPSGEFDQMVLAALGWAAPTPASTTGARSYTVLRGHIANVGLAADLKATLTPPSGSTVLSTSPAATPDAAGRPVWTFLLESGATKDLDTGLQLPETDGSYTASLAIDSIRNGITTHYGSFDVTIGVEAAGTIATRVIADLAALTLSYHDRNDRDAAIWYIQAAQHALAEGEHEAAIAKLVAAAEKLLKITSANVTPQRVDLARLLQDAQVRWTGTQP